MSTMRWAVLGCLLVAATAGPADETRAMPLRYLIAALRVTGPTLTVDGAAEGHAVATFDLVNRGETPERLVAANIEGGQVLAMTSQQDTDTIEGSAIVLPPGRTLRVRLAVTLDTAGDKTRSAPKGERMRGTLRFERAGPLPVVFTITEAAQLAPPAP